MLIVLTLVGMRFVAAADQPSKSSGEPAKRINFTLKATDGKDVSFSDYQSKKAGAIVLVGTECPLVNLYVNRLKELQKEFAGQNVQILRSTAIRKTRSSKSKPMPRPMTSLSRC